MALEQIGEIVVGGETRSIQLNLEDSRFEIWVNDELAFLRFHLHGPKLSLIHTEVPPPLQHQGLADALARASLEYARAHSLRVKVIYPFVAKFLARHPEFEDIVTVDDT